MVLCTDKMRVTLDGPNGWPYGWVADRHHTPIRLKRQQGGGGIIIWAGINNSELVGPIRMEDGLKMNPRNYCKFLGGHLP